MTTSTKPLSEAAHAIANQAREAFSAQLASFTDDKRAALSGAIEDAAATTAAVAFAQDDQARAAAVQEQRYALSTLASIAATEAEETRQRWQQAAYVALHTATRAAIDALIVL